MRHLKSKQKLLTKQAHEPLIFNDKDKHSEFYEKRNKVLAFAIEELSKVESESLYTNKNKIVL